MTIPVPEQPSKAGIDPKHLLIDLEMDNNIQNVKIEAVQEEEEEPDLI